MTNPHVERAYLLLQQSRHELAEQELRQALTHDPNDAMTHSLLGICLSARKAFDEATAAAQQGVHLAPDQSFSYYALASVFYDRNRYPEAETAVREAISLEPHAVGFHGLLAAIKFEQRDWQSALQAAEQGLAIDPENVRCANLRAMALNKLGRTHDATDSLRSALAKEPENAEAHANLGWTQLQQGRPKEALESFREALRLDPESQWARAGMVEALQARYFLYRWLLAYFLWISRLSEGAQWGVIIGGYVGYRVLGNVARNSPDLAIYIRPLLWAYIAFAVMTWIGVPIFNLLLRLNRYGRYALSRDKIVASNWVGLTLLTAILFLIGAFLFQSPGLLIPALMVGILVLPVAGTFNLHPGWPRNMMALYTTALAAVAIVFCAAAFLPGLFGDAADGVASGALPMFFIGVFVSQFVANALAHRTPRR